MRTLMTSFPPWEVLSARFEQGRGVTAVPPVGGLLPA
jgi:hypothetical protein